MGLAMDTAVEPDDAAAAAAADTAAAATALVNLELVMVAVKLLLAQGLVLLLVVCAFVLHGVSVERRLRMLEADMLLPI
jgi:hypothetical protein